MFHHLKRKEEERFQHGFLVELRLHDNRSWQIDPACTQSTVYVIDGILNNYYENIHTFVCFFHPLPPSSLPSTSQFVNHFLIPCPISQDKYFFLKKNTHITKKKRSNLYLENQVEIPSSVSLSCASIKEEEEEEEKENK